MLEQALQPLSTHPSEQKAAAELLQQAEGQTGRRYPSIFILFASSPPPTFAKTHEVFQFLRVVEISISHDVDL